jgi:hypothetical protein
MRRQILRPAMRNAMELHFIAFAMHGENSSYERLRKEGGSN